MHNTSIGCKQDGSVNLGNAVGVNDHITSNRLFGGVCSCNRHFQRPYSFRSKGIKRKLSKLTFRQCFHSSANAENSSCSNRIDAEYRKMKRVVHFRCIYFVGQINYSFRQWACSRIAATTFFRIFPTGKIERTIEEFMLFQRDLIIHRNAIMSYNDCFICVYIGIEQK